MLLYGNIDFSNAVFDDIGMVGETIIPFTLPARLSRRSKITLKYFAYHSGLSWDVTDMQTGQFSLLVGDKPKQKLYQYRGTVKHIDMKVLADGANIMHDHSSSHIVDDENGMTIEDDVRNKETITFPPNKVSDASLHNGSVAFDYIVDSPISAFRGYSKMYNLELGHVDASVSHIDVVLTGAHLAIKGTSEFSFEENIRMDRISIVMELQ